MDENKLRIGQRLWYQNKNNHKVGHVIVKQVNGDKFTFLLDNKLFEKPIDWIGTRLYRSLVDIPLIADAVSDERKADAPQLELPAPQDKKGNGVAVDTPVEPPPRRKPSCDICALRKNGTCGSLANQLCEDYCPTQYISKEEMDSYPKYGLATEIRMKGRK